MTIDDNFDHQEEKAEWVKPQVRQISAGSAEDSQDGTPDGSVNPS